MELSVAVHAPQGSRVIAVGAHSLLGSWRPEKGLSLEETCAVWSASLSIPESEAKGIEYKYVIQHPDGGTTWEDGENRRLPRATREPDVGRFPGLPPVPVAASSSSTGSDLAASEHEIVWLAVCKNTAPGDAVVVVGAAAALGAWCPDAALRLATSATTYPVWQGVARIASKDLHTPWKLAIIRAGGGVEWEEVQDRLVPVPPEAAMANVRVEFGGDVRLAGAVMTPRAPGKDLSPSDVKAEAAMARQQVQESSADGQSLRAFRDLARGPATSRGDSFSTVASEESASEPEDGEEDDTSVSAGSPLVGGKDGGLRTGSYQLCKPGGRCEDAFFERACAIGVADGVGQMVQFERFGVDSAAYARDLMCGSTMAFEPGGPASDPMSDAPEEQAAAAVAFAEGEVDSYGAATICVVCLRRGQLGVANLGDSGFMLLRRGDDGMMGVVTRSEEQQHSWNCPFQLLRVPPSLARRLPSNTRLDSPSDCRRYRLPVSPGDLVLAYTDGLSDNLHEHEILEIVNREVKRTSGGSTRGPPREGAASASRIAKALATAAHDRSLDEEAEVPFCVTARGYGHRLIGGKTDDITVVVAWVTQEGAQAPSKE